MQQPPKVECDLLHPILSVPNVTAAVDFYTSKLGFTFGFTWPDSESEPQKQDPTTAGVGLGKMSIHFQKGPPPGAPPSETTIYFVIDDADALFQFQRAQGVEIKRDIADRPWSFRDFTVRDLNGYLLTFGQRLSSTTTPPPKTPPLTIERVDRNDIRLEKRLAHLLDDLAAHKSMSVSECLEEMILHSFENASPHTSADRREIEKLRTKHAITYDAHDAYRFVEKK